MATTYTIAIIGARSGSKGVPHKNVRPLAGLPLLAHSIRTAKQVPSIQRVIVSTDSDEYAQIALAHGAEVFMRPAAISTDTSTDYEYVRNVIDRCLRFDPMIPHLAVLLRPTTPLRDPTVVAEAIDFAIASKREYTSLRSVHQAPESAYKQFRAVGGLLVPLEGETIESANAPRQSHPETCIANGYVDIVSPEFILNEGVLWGDKVAAYLTPPTHEIDTEEDFEFLAWQVTGKGAA